MQKYIEKMTGYKATDANMQCRGFQFELGVLVECPEGDLIKCGSNGFHFCEQPSGPWAYYSAPGTRIFKVEAFDVLDAPREPGADAKYVCRKILLLEEVNESGDRNTGNWNTGDLNTGSGNTGDGNTGDGNTGYGNTGDRNTGDWNTGYGNTGDRNTGDWNTGYGNTGDRNTGDWNTGDRNTGDRNTGSGNTGDGNTGYGNTGSGNTTNYSCGFFCVEETTVRCFDVDSHLLRADFTSQFPEYYQLSVELLSPVEIDYNKYTRLPGITPAKLKTLHAKHIKGREIT